MRAVPFHLPAKAALDVSADISGEVVSGGNLKEGYIGGGGYELSSVLEPRWSPSPPTSTSTLSTSLGGGAGGGSTDTAGAPAASDATRGRLDEWPSDLPPISATPAPPDLPSADKCGLVVAVDDWEHMLSDPAAGEHSFFRWFMSDFDDTSLKQLLQGGAPGSAEFEAGLVLGCGGGGVGGDPVLGLDGPNSATANLPFTAGELGPNINNGCIVNARAIPNNSAHNHVKSSMILGSNLNLMSNQIMSASSNLPPLPISVTAAIDFQEAMDEKPQILNPQVLINPQEVHPRPNPAFCLPISYAQDHHHHHQLILPPPAKRHQPALIDPSFQFAKPGLADSGQELFLQQLRAAAARPKATFGGDIASAQQQALVEQLVKVSELVEAGNLVHARGILARLNHQLSDVGKPLQRAAYFFKEALLSLLSSSPLASSASPLDVVFKISAYKAFSEISPFLHFTNFTSNQALLEALDGFDRIHIVDFDVGIGGQWASFMQELAVSLRSAPSLRITAFVSMASHHPLELTLTRDNLTQFANDLNILFEFNVIDLDAVEYSTALALPLLNLSNNEAVAVNFAGGESNLPAPLVLRLVKQLSPKIVVSVDHGFDRVDLSSQYFIHSLKCHSVLLESLDAVNVNFDAVRKIERYLIQPRIERAVLGRNRVGEKLPSWRTLFASTGFSPVAFSNFTETQAECLVRRSQVRGFHVEKRHVSLYLCWQHRELVSVSAWRC